jgi:uncharacterized low-complexity protein
VPALVKPSARLTIGKLTVAAGGTAMATSVVLGLVARQRYHEAANTVNSMGEAVCTPAEGDDLECGDGNVVARLKSARQLGNVGTIVGGAGLAVALVGGYLWYFAPRPYAERGRVSVVPRVSAGGGGIAIIGRF